MNNSVLLQIENLQKHFIATKGLTRRVIGIVKAVDDVNLFIREGETLGLVGESGCGKTTVGRCILRAIEPTAGKIYFKLDDNSVPVDICTLDNNRLKKVRRYMRLIFQDPYSSLNPRMNVMDIIAEPLIINHLATKKNEIEEQVAETMVNVGLDPRHMRRYPHAFSGGQRQRIAIARALVSEPKFVVADEPVSALDVSIQAQILNLLMDLQEQLNLTYLFITHDLSVVKHISQKIAVMYLGKIVEITETDELFNNPLHPYTQALLSAIPSVNIDIKKKRIILKGDVPSPINPKPICRFFERCWQVTKECEEIEPSLELKKPNHWVSCIKVTPKIKN